MTQAEGRDNGRGEISLRDKAVVLGVAIVGALVLSWWRFGYEYELPTKPERPEYRSAFANTNEAQELYNSYLAEDAELYGIRPIRRASLGRPFPYKKWSQARLLHPGDRVNLEGVMLHVFTKTIKGTHQLMLTIENRDHVPKAYRVLTQVSAGDQQCTRKESVPHNAVALLGGGLATRSECTYRKGRNVKVLSVEVIELPEIGYYYISAMPPKLLGLRELAARGHVLPRTVKPCKPLHSARVHKAVKEGTLSFRDLVDFYARHRCYSYTIPPSYRASEDQDLLLPILGDVLPVE